MTKNDITADLEKLICALADIGSDESDGDGWRRKKAQRLYREMRLKYPDGSLESAPGQELATWIESELADAAKSTNPDQWKAGWECALAEVLKRLRVTPEPKPPRTPQDIIDSMTGEEQQALFRALNRQAGSAPAAAAHGMAQ
jgi:hypothetical protein